MKKLVLLLSMPLLLLAPLPRGEAQDEKTAPDMSIRAMDGYAHTVYRSPKAAQDDASKLFKTPAGSGWGEHWFEYLPPCADAESDIDKSEWADDDPTTAAYFHKGAKSYRSKRLYRSAYDDGQNDSWHGQQACYKQGRLITNPNDEGAGSPDFRAPGTLPHLNTDVIPWFLLGYRLYNQYWPVQKGTGEAFHVLVGRTVRSQSPFVSGTHPKPGGTLLESQGWRDTLLNVRAGDVISLQTQGKVVWGYKGESCDADGDPSTEKKTIWRELVSPRPFDARIGILMATVLDNDHLPDPKSIKAVAVGAKYRYVAQTSGRLWLGINDGLTSNNSGYFDVKIKRLSQIAPDPPPIG